MIGLRVFDVGALIVWLVWFFRPLISLAWSVDAIVGKEDPFLAHAGNAVAVASTRHAAPW